MLSTTHWEKVIKAAQLLGKLRTGGIDRLIFHLVKYTETNINKKNQEAKNYVEVFNVLTHNMSVITLFSLKIGTHTLELILPLYPQQKTFCIFTLFKKTKQT